MRNLQSNLDRWMFTNATPSVFHQRHVGRVLLPRTKTCIVTRLVTVNSVQRHSSRRCASARNAPCAGERGPRLHADQRVPGSKCVGRARHGLDRKAATPNVRKRVAAEEHQVGVVLVDPEGDFRFAVRIAELHARVAIRIPFEVGKRVVERYRADPSRLTKIVFGPLHGLAPDRKAALVGSQDRSPGRLQSQTVDRWGPEGQIWMSAASIGTSVRAEVRGRRLHPEAIAGECIFDTDSEQKRIARSWIKNVLHHHPVWLSLGGGPGGPTNETVDRVAALRLVQWDLVAAPVELIAPVLQPVRPRDQDLAPARRTHLVGAISVEKLAAADRVRAESAADRDDHSLLVLGQDRDLLAGWGDHPFASPGDYADCGSDGRCATFDSLISRSASLIAQAALTSPMWLKACGKLPRSSRVFGSTSSASRPRSLAKATARENVSLACSTRPAIACACANQNVHRRNVPSSPSRPSWAR